MHKCTALEEDGAFTLVINWPLRVKPVWEKSDYAKNPNMPSAGGTLSTNQICHGDPSVEMLP